MINATDIKRQIFQSADSSIVKKHMEKTIPGISIGEQIELGNELEKTTKTGGWTIIEQYMLTKMNLVGLAVTDGSELNRGVAKAFIEMMQWIHLTIQRRNKLLEQEKLKYETETVPENETD